MCRRAILAIEGRQERKQKTNTGILHFVQDDDIWGGALGWMDRMQRRISILVKAVLGAALCLPLAGCLVAGYSSGGGWWVWPGSLAITVLMLLTMFLLSRR